MADQLSAPPGSQTLPQGLADLRQTWEHLARELAGGVPELPGVIDQELAGLTLPDLNEETLIRVTEGVVARVAAAGFPDEASALFRRMGRAMYELLLLLATQEEIRGMGSKPSPGGLDHPRPTVASLPANPPRPVEFFGSRPPVVGTPALAAVAPAPAGQRPAAPAAPAGPPAVAAEAPKFDLPDRPPSSQPALTPATPVAGPAWLGEPRDPARPDPVRNGATAVPPTLLEPTDPSAANRTQSQPAPPVAPQPIAPVAAAVKKPAAELAPLLPLEERKDAPAAPPTLVPAQRPPPARPLAHAQAPPPPPPAPPPPSAGPAPSAPVRAPARTPVPTPRDLTEAEAPLWGFDPANREGSQSEEPAPESVGEPVLDPVRAAPAPVTAPSPRAAPALVPASRATAGPRSGWTVRLSPRTSGERDRKLQAREAQLPILVEEIVATAKSQQAALSARGNARRVLAAAREALPLADGADPSTQIQSLLESGQLEEAAAMAVQMAGTLPGEEAAAIACAVGEGVKQAKQVELAVLCFTTAVLCAPPCDRACWQLCTLSVERRDTELAPVWLEYVARLLRSRGADTDSISVYRQLLKLTPRRSDIRELLRISSLTGTLPD